MYLNSVKIIWDGKDLETWFDNIQNLVDALRWNSAGASSFAALS
jgi:hypothetical protein